MKHHCYLCGAALVMSVVECREKEICSSCGWVYHPQLKVGSGVLIVQKGRLLLLKRAGDPFLGKWNLPAGYVEVDEPPARAAEREAQEETGLLVQAERLVDVYYFCDDPRGNGIFLVYKGHVQGGEVIVSPESCEVKYFSADEIPELLAGGGHDQAIWAWKNAYDGSR